MKRNFILAASLALVFTGVSCEKHSWNDEIKEVVEVTTDADGKVVSSVTTLDIEEKGAVRFFKEEKHAHGHDEHAHKDSGKKEHGEHSHKEGGH